MRVLMRVDAVPVDVQLQQRLGGDLADAVVGVRAAGDVGDRASSVRGVRPTAWLLEA